MNLTLISENKMVCFGLGFLCLAIVLAFQIGTLEPTAVPKQGHTYQKPAAVQKAITPSAVPQQMGPLKLDGMGFGREQSVDENQTGRFNISVDYEF